jgi:elongation factor Ts
MPKDSEEDPKLVCLLEQSYLKDESVTIAELVRDTIAKTGENVRIKRFARFELGN